MNKEAQFKKNDIVRFWPEYEDGANQLDYILIEGPDGNRVKVHFLAFDTSTLLFGVNLGRLKDEILIIIKH